MKTVMAVLCAAVVAAFVLFPTSTAEAQTSSYGTCYAYTTCPSGGYVTCTVYGNSSAGQACNWRVVPGVEVECNGYVATPYGWMWQHFYFHC